jgi:Tfp pilus assembly protein PilP
VNGRRDPFISSVSTAAAAAAVCNSGGKRCLAIDRISLKGVVRSGSGFIAVVVNAANRAYFLRENDPLMNGYVVRITSNAVTFKQTDKDRTGHPVTHVVTLTLSVPAA